MNPFSQSVVHRGSFALQRSTESVKARADRARDSDGGGREKHSRGQS